MNQLKILLTSIGFIFTGFVFSAYAPNIMLNIRTLTNEVFATNCKVILCVSEQSTTLPQTCRIIQQLLPSLLMANGLLLLIFKMTRWTSLISILSLSLLVLFYCNPSIDNSFTNYSHFLTLVVCIAAFLSYFLQQADQKQSSS